MVLLNRKITHVGEPKKTSLLVLTTDLMESQRTYNTKSTIL